MSDPERTKNRAMAYEAYPEPRTVVSFMLNQSLRDERVTLSTHVDSILAILVTFNNHLQTGLKIKGRCVDEPGQTMAIVNDDVYDLFAKWRTGNREDVFRYFRDNVDNSGYDTSQILLPVDTGSGVKFPVQYYSADELVAKYLDGNITPNHLMPVLGGATMHTIGSDEAGREQLLGVAGELTSEITRRQIGDGVLLGDYQQQ